MYWKRLMERCNGNVKRGVERCDSCQYIEG